MAEPPSADPADGSQSKHRSRGYLLDSLQRTASDPSARVGAGILLAFLLMALAAPLISVFATHRAPDQQDVENVYQGISSAHWLGTDELGRDTMTRLAFGAQVSLEVGFLTVILYILAGATAGLVAGYFGGWLDEVLMRIVDVLLAVPSIFLLILISSLLPVKLGPIRFQHDAFTVSVILAFTAWGGIARLVRAEVLALKSREFIAAAKSIGASDIRILWRHVLPNALPVIIIAASLGLGGVILAEAALDFIGIGVQPPTPSWGNMLVNAQSYFYHQILLVLAPGACIFIIVLGANLLGTAIRDGFDPRLR